jgi:putative phosphoribosyl transferase
MTFRNRSEAGQRLAARLTHLRGQDVVVVGLPRGGVPVAAEVAQALDAPLDVILVRKLGLPFQPEVAMGAIGEDGVRVVDDEVLRLAAITRGDFEAVEAFERRELARRAARYRADRPRVTLSGKTVVVVDDGIATGSTARAACAVARAQGAARVVLAVPVAPPDWRFRLAGAADELTCVLTPSRFDAVGQFYEDFSATTDDEVLACLRRADRPVPAGIADDPPLRDEEVEVAIGTVSLRGHLTVPEQPRGVVIFVHGSGSSRHSARNRYVALVLNGAGFATLLFDLLTPSEETDRAHVFDVAGLATRLGAVTRWVRLQPETNALPIGYFGASTGGAAALTAAAGDHSIAAVVVRGGRPDLAEDALQDVTAPTLLVVGGNDDVVLDLNRRAQAHLGGAVSELTIVPGATHLFEEPNALELVAELAEVWFLDHLAVPAQPVR